MFNKVKCVNNETTSEKIMDNGFELKFMDFNCIKDIIYLLNKCFPDEPKYKDETWWKTELKENK